MISLIDCPSQQEHKWLSLLNDAIRDGWKSSTKQNLLKIEEEEILPLKKVYSIYDKPGSWMIYSGIPWSNKKLSENKLETLWKSSSCSLCPSVTKWHNVGGGSLNPLHFVVGDAPGAGPAPRDIFGSCMTNGPTSFIVRYFTYKMGILEDCWFSNMIKCAVPDNRYVTTKEYSTCSPFFMEEITLLKPKHIFALGNGPFNRLVSSDIPAKITPLLHPGFFLRSRASEKDYLQHVKIQLLEKGFSK